MLCVIPLVTINTICYPCMCDTVMSQWRPLSEMVDKSQFMRDVCYGHN